jgi:hypothetical protein
MRNFDTPLKRFFTFVFLTAIFSFVSLNLPKKVNAQCYPCDTSQANLSVSPNPVGAGQQASFSVQAYGQATTCIQDSIGGVNTSACSNYTSNHINLGSGGSGTATCTATSQGTYTFTHQWEPITSMSVGCDVCSPCQKSVTFTVGPVTSSAPPPPSTGGSMRGSCGTDEVDTAIGCIPYGTSNALVTFLLRWGIGIAGGIAFILMIFAGFQIITSAGNPKRLSAGKELLVAALSGLLLLIFSAFLLKLLGKDILNLPGF